MQREFAAAIWAGVVPDLSMKTPGGWFDLSREARAAIVAAHTLDTMGGAINQADHADWRKAMRLD